jgi:hypothetical protein
MGGGGVPVGATSQTYFSVSSTLQPKINLRPSPMGRGGERRGGWRQPSWAQDAQFYEHIFPFQKQHDLTLLAQLEQEGLLCSFWNWIKLYRLTDNPVLMWISSSVGTVGSKLCGLNILCDRKCGNGQKFERLLWSEVRGQRFVVRGSEGRLVILLQLLAAMRTVQHRSYQIIICKYSGRKSSFVRSDITLCFRTI